MAGFPSGSTIFSRSTVKTAGVETVPVDATPHTVVPSQPQHQYNHSDAQGVELPLQFMTKLRKGFFILHDDAPNSRLFLVQAFNCNPEFITLQIRIDLAGIFQGHISSVRQCSLSKFCLPTRTFWDDAYGNLLWKR